MLYCDDHVQMSRVTCNVLSPIVIVRDGSEVPNLLDVRLILLTEKIEILNGYLSVVKGLVTLNVNMNEQRLTEVTI